DARRSLVGDAAVRVGDAIAHRVDLARDLPHLVASVQDERAGEVAGAGAPGLVADEREGAPDEPHLEKDREQRADEDDRYRRTDYRQVAQAYERPLLRERLRVLERRRLRCGPDG